MPLNFTTATAAELELERNSVHLALQKLATLPAWSEVSKSAATNLLQVKTELEDVYRLLSSDDLAQLTKPQRADLLLRLKSTADKVTFAYQIQYISLSASPDTTKEFFTDYSFSGLSHEQAKRVQEIAKKRDDKDDKADYRKYETTRRKPYYYSPYPSPYTPKPAYPPANNYQNPPQQYQAPPQQYQAPHTPFLAPTPPLLRFAYNPPPPAPVMYYDQQPYSSNYDTDRKKWQIEKEKATSTCNDCGERGHWKGDLQCRLAMNRVAGYMLH